MQTLIKLWQDSIKSRIFVSSSLMVAATLLFVVNDSLIKYFSQNDMKFYHFVFYGTPVYILVPVGLSISGKLKKNMVSTNYLIPIIRGFIFVPLPVIAFVALGNISLPEFTTLIMCAPIFSICFSTYILKEKLNFFLISSVIAGIVGVICVFQPGFQSFNYYFLLVLISAILVALSNLMVSKYHTVVSPIGFFIYGGVFVHIFSWGLFSMDPRLFNFYTTILIIFGSLAANLAIFLFVVAFSVGQKVYGAISCLHYLQIFWAVLIGTIFFGEYLNWLSGLGTVLIIASGLLAVIAQNQQILIKKILVG